MASYAAPAESTAAPEQKAVDLPSLEARIQWVEYWDEQTREARRLSRVDRDYYDGKQWTAEELEILKARNQPPLIKNRIARKINFVCGEEIKKRVDPVARPRTPQHEDSARAATDALRYVEEEQGFDSVRSAVLFNMLVEGLGGALKELEQEDDGFKHRLRHIEWDRLFWDPHSRDPMFSDARYLGVILWMDIEDAVERWPAKEKELREALLKDIAASNDTTEDVPKRWSDKRRQRVKVAEMFFRVGKDWYRACFTQGDDLDDVDRTPYLDENQRHSVCPLKLASCYVDAEGNRYGLVRNLISPQDEINKRASKSLHLLNVKQVIAEEGAVLDPQEFRTQLAKADGLAIVQPGAIQSQRILIEKQMDLAAAQVQLMQAAQQDIDSIGPSAATMPELPNSASGRAFMARQQAAAQELGAVFDRLRMWTHGVFEIDWLCVRQYWDEEKWLRITDDQEKDGYRFTALNQRMTRMQRMQDLIEKGTPPPKAFESAAGNLAPVIMGQIRMQQQAMAQQQRPPQPGMPQQPPPKPPDPMQMVAQHPLMHEQITVNQVDQMLVDIIIDDAPETAVLAQEQFATLSELLGPVIQANPQMAGKMVRLLVKASDLPDKRELVQDLDKPPDPQQQQMQQAMQQLQVQGAQAGVEVQKTQAQLNAARAAQAQADAQTTVPVAQADIEAKKAQAMSHAATAGEKAGGPQPGGFSGPR